MAYEAVLLPVVGEMRVAVRAVEHLAAVGADHHRGKAAAVQEKEHLVPRLKLAPRKTDERWGES